LGLIATLAIIVTPILLFAPRGHAQRDTPWANVPESILYTDHSQLLKGPYTSGPDVTHACLECHPNAAQEVAHTTHWTWESDPVYVPERGDYYRLGKKTAINNFCIGIQANWPACTACHAGYGWSDASFDFSNVANVDCLVCHDGSGAYAKADSGYPAEGVDLATVAQSVTNPTRENCGSCHFFGGGGDAVKHGDLDASLYFPNERIDVHMGKYDFQCVTCHQTDHHQIQGRSISVNLSDLTTNNQVACTDCHNPLPHDDERINEHVDTVACQTCHIPTMAKKESTKIDWDWSTAGQDLPEDPHQYLKIKGSFVYEKDLPPEYRWFNGTAYRYLWGDVIDPTQTTPINLPKGDISDPNAKIWPFKIHRGKQVYDSEYNYLLQPKTAGEGGFWTEYDWDLALRLGSEVTGLVYSGHYDFAPTEMYWPTTHMISPREDALQCVDCHGENGRLDWVALGYPGDPIKFGGRQLSARTAPTGGAEQ
jgi:octaheme c-type cytochrome (tetrathionate reductase family)